MMKITGAVVGPAGHTYRTNYAAGKQMVVNTGTLTADGHRVLPKNTLAMLDVSFDDLPADLEPLHTPHETWVPLNRPFAKMLAGAYDLHDPYETAVTIEIFPGHWLVATFDLEPRDPETDTSEWTLIRSGQSGRAIFDPVNKTFSITLGNFNGCTIGSGHNQGPIIFAYVSIIRVVGNEQIVLVREIVSNGSILRAKPTTGHRDRASARQYRSTNSDRRYPMVDTAGPIGPIAQPMLQPSLSEPENLAVSDAQAMDIQIECVTS